MAKMAHTPNGNLRGAARRTEIADQKQWLQDLAWQSERDEEARKQAIIEALMQQAYDIEGDTFIEWWEDDNNVPASITPTDQILTLERRLLQIAQPKNHTPKGVAPHEARTESNPDIGRTDHHSGTG